MNLFMPILKWRLKKSLAQLEGSFSHWITILKKHLLKALAFSEASFEFIDEEMTFGHRNTYQC